MPRKYFSPQASAPQNPHFCSPPKGNKNWKWQTKEEINAQAPGEITQPMATFIQSFLRGLQGLWILLQVFTKAEGEPTTREEVPPGGGGAS